MIAAVAAARGDRLSMHSSMATMMNMMHMDMMAMNKMGTPPRALSDKAIGRPAHSTSRGWRNTLVSGRTCGEVTPGRRHWNGRRIANNAPKRSAGTDLPFEGEIAGEHTIEATSRRVPGTLVHRTDLWDRCYEDLMTTTAVRLEQEIGRMGGTYAHVLAESIDPRHDDVSCEAWLHGRFTYMLYNA